ncbi:DUF2812 domain-containing protein [Virgibacillus sp. AGTR]|uniref:DUF2812 domain-containing protein n=1 Tax=Virgibacillus salarius TaxID=447199 RepID=A0A941ICA6_9BACI|nr:MULTISPECIES: DUF2812 domain-containing protein [Virgibacillus]MBR7797207.1 DUF2812 domain-containing protein [Virgibacillus salarius]MCC2251805.1 DUF2812 domain-containing protein [Virgibacillus sp. AGTR]NAZ09916.1 DUF2812 domain-containing protein [Agaribacter marinus]QRZ19260.1 DUF2812 domain-containing protein [Virgibacillus sp. AGTR]
MISVFRPFWSYDVNATENWLTYMAQQGYHFVKFNRLTRRFYFEKAGTIMQTPTYWIEHEKRGKADLSKALQEDGWRQIYAERNWHVLRNEKTLHDITTLPAREGMIRRNDTLRKLFFILLLALIFTALPPVLLLGVSLVMAGVPPSVEGGPGWLFTALIGLSLWMYIPYSFFKLNQSVKQLEACDVLENKQRLSQEKYTSDFVKWRLGWIYAPDKLEKWLEAMAKQGKQFVAVRTFGIRFYFKDSRPQHIRYCVDYQKELNRAYFDMHLGAGWRLMHASKGFMNKWSIWSMAYEEGEELPQLYNDTVHMLDHAKRIAFSHLFMMLPMTSMYVVLFSMQWSADMGKMDWFMLIVFGIAVIEFATFSLQSGLYYQRIRKRVSKFFP